MEAATVLQSSSGFLTPADSSARSRPLLTSGSNLIRCDIGFRVSDGRFQKHRPISHTTAGHGRIHCRSSRRTIAVRAAATPSESDGASSPVAPLQLESPVGQFLSQILLSHPHLVPAAVDQQLEQLQTDIAAEKKEAPSATGTELVLYRRIAEVKANERKKALEEILYALVVQKFMAANISLVPTMSASSPGSRVDTWPPQEEKLKQLHSSEAYEMVQNHLSLILGNKINDSTSVALINKLRVGQVYAASVMYGYFLKRVDQRFQLEKAMKFLPNAADPREIKSHDDLMVDTLRLNDEGDSLADEPSHPESSSWAGGISPGGFGYGIKPSRLRSYVMSFDAETLQVYAMIRSREAISIIEKHTEALFGRPEISFTPQGTIDPSKDELIKISFTGLKGLVLEAAAFGSFLWDVESYVDSRCHFVTN